MKGTIFMKGAALMTGTTFVKGTIFVVALKRMQHMIRRRAWDNIE